MAEVIEFFLKMDSGMEADVGKPPFILHFGIPKDRIEEVRRQADLVIKGLLQQRPFANASHAAQFTIANSILLKDHHKPDVRQILCILLVHLATDSQEKRDALAGAKMIGYLIAPSPQALANAPTDTPPGAKADDVIASLLQTGISPYRFRFATLMPAA
jgi:hypothetical protein